MKKLILKNGIISGIIVTVFMICGTFIFYKNTNTQWSMALGYIGMLIAFSFIFIGIIQYRNSIGEGYINYWQGFKIGFFIALISSTFYVVTWLIEFYTVFPDFMEKYVEQTLKTATENGASEAQLEQQKLEMASYTELYKNPFGVTLLTYIEILPLGILVSLLAAAILKKKKN